MIRSLESPPSEMSVCDSGLTGRIFSEVLFIYQVAVIAGLDGPAQLIRGRHHPADRYAHHHPEIVKGLDVAGVGDGYDEHTARESHGQHSTPPAERLGQVVEGHRVRGFEIQVLIRQPAHLRQRPAEVFFEKDLVGDQDLAETLAGPPLFGESKLNLLSGHQPGGDQLCAERGMSRGLFGVDRLGSQSAWLE